MPSHIVPKALSLTKTINNLGASRHSIYDLWSVALKIML